MMDYVLAAIGIVAIILLLLGLLRKNGQPVATDTSGMLLLQKEVAALRSAVDVKLSETTQRMETSLTESSRLVKDITSEIGALKDIGVKTGQFADEVRKLVAERFDFLGRACFTDGGNAVIEQFRRGRIT